MASVVNILRSPNSLYWGILASCVICAGVSYALLSDRQNTFIGMLFYVGFAWGFGTDKSRFRDTTGKQRVLCVFLVTHTLLTVTMVAHGFRLDSRRSLIFGLLECALISLAIL